MTEGSTAKHAKHAKEPRPRSATGVATRRAQALTIGRGPAGEISRTNTNDRRRARPARAAATGRRYLIALRRRLGPDAEHASSVGDAPFVIAEEGIVARERLVRPGVIGERLAAVGRSRERHTRPAIGRIAAPIVELHVHRSIRRI